MLLIKIKYKLIPFRRRYKNYRKGWIYMKKILSKIILVTLVMALCMGMGAISSSAFMGLGVQVMANDVKLIKTGLLGKRLTFSDSDVKTTLNVADFDSITITEIPKSTEGTLMYGGRRVSAGRVIKRKNMGLLSFIPASNTVAEASFKFSVDSYASGVSIECVMKFVDKVNYAPSADEMPVVRTQGEISYYGRLDGQDPEGDSLKFMIVSSPKNGEVVITDDETGRYVYTPDDGFTGKDRFSYVVRDEFGNYSGVRSVEVRVSERMCDAEYVDLEGRGEYNGAVAMTAMGIMGGYIQGDDTYFGAEETVTRAEFVAMAMKAMGVRADSTLTKTFFDDDADIPRSLRSYVATAARIGIVGGDFVDGRLLFSPNENITNYEIAKIIATLASFSEGDEMGEFFENDSVPTWARGSVSAMYTLGIFDIEDTAPDAVATKAEVADYLYKMLLLCQ